MLKSYIIDFLLDSRFKDLEEEVNKYIFNKWLLASNAEEREEVARLVSGYRLFKVMLNKLSK